MRARPLVAFACCAISLLVAPSASGAELIATTDATVFGGLTASRGTVLWTSGGSYTGRVRFFARDDAGIRMLPTLTFPATSRVSSADLGPDGSEGLAVVFARCTDEGEGVGICSVYRAGLGQGLPSPVSGASAKRYDEFAPAVWKNTVVFVRQPTTTYSGRFPVPTPLRGLFKTSPPARLAKPPACCDHGVTRSAIVDSDLRGHIVTYLASQQTTRREPGLGEVDRTYTTIVVKRFDRHGHGTLCVVARGRSGTNIGSGGPSVTLAQPRLDGRYVYWQRTFSPGDYTVRSAIHRRLLPTRHCHPRGPEQWKLVYDNPFGNTGLSGLAVDRGRIYYAIPGYGTTSLYETSAADFVNR